MMKPRSGLLMVLPSGALLLNPFGLAAASAVNEYVGQSYSQVSSSLAANGAKAIVGAVVGNQKPLAECIVTGSRKVSYLDSSGNGRGYWILVDLNCNDELAGAHPGNSTMSEAGKKAKIVMGFIEAWNKGSIASCLKSADSAKWCLSQCDKYGGCSAETQETLISGT